MKHLILALVASTSLFAEDICIIGTGYVGLVTGTCLAEKGHDVTCIDIDQEKIGKLKQGIIPIYEPGLESLIVQNVKAGRLHFTTEYPKSDFYFICVPTPSDQHGACDLSFVLKVAQTIGENLGGYAVVINKSTVPVGSAAKVTRVIADTLKTRNVDFTFDLVSNPEFLKEGCAVDDCLHPDRIVIGCKSEKAGNKMRALYAPFDVASDRVLVMNTESAELTKYASNAMLAARISFMNELSQICEAVGANIDEIRVGMGTDTRIGPAFLYAGAGYGGSCFPKDLRALHAIAKENGLDAPLVRAVDVVNENQKRVLGKKVKRYFDNNLEGKTIALWGLAFKPNTDDLREAPALTLIKDLQGANIRVYDPIAMEKAHALGLNVTFCNSAEEAAKGADAVVLVTEWEEFRKQDLGIIHSLVKGPAFFDGRNQFSQDEMGEKGFTYFPIGMPQP